MFSGQKFFIGWPNAMLFSKPGQTDLEQFFSANCLRTEDSGGVSKVIHDHLFLHNNLQTGIPKLLYSTRRSGLLTDTEAFSRTFQPASSRLVTFACKNCTKFVKSFRYTVLLRNLCFRENYRKAGCILF